MLSSTAETNNEAVNQPLSRLQSGFQTALEQLNKAGEALKKFANREQRDETLY